MPDQTPTQQPLLEWKAEQLDHYEHGTLWYVCAGSFFALCIAYSIWTAAWTFTVVITLVAGLYLFAHKRIPEKRTMRIWPSGYAIGNEFYNWNECRSYWITKSNISTSITIEHNKAFTRNTKILLGDIEPQVLHATLDPYIVESINKKENLIDTIIHICKL